MNEGFVFELQEVCKKAKELKIKICLDVAKPMMAKIGCPDVYALRLDYGFKLDEIVKYYKEKKYVVELNASTISYDDLIYLKNKGKSRTSNNQMKRTKARAFLCPITSYSIYCDI